jgi:hypothetical protein
MPIDLRDVAVAGHLRPVALQHGSAVGVVLDLNHDLEPVGLDRPVQPTDAGEQAKKGRFVHL